MMKILLATESGGNSYISNLYSGLQKGGAEVCLGHRLFWTDCIQYDLVHLHWIEYLAGWNHKLYLKFLKRLKEFKSRGIPIVITRHNRYPHGRPGKKYYYDDAYQYCDAVVHMGQASKDDFNQHYPDVEHLSHAVIPHPNYDDLPDYLTREQCRDILGLKPETKVMLVFGQVRTLKEAEFVINVYRHLNIENKHLIATGWLAKQFVLWRKADLLWRKYTLKQSNQLSSLFVPDHSVQIYLKSADALFLPRLSGSSINSGVMPLAFTFGVPVVGPAQGVMGELAHSVKLPVYNSNEEAVSALEKVLGHSDEAIWSDQMRVYSRDQMNHDLVAESHLSLYRQLLSVKK